MGEGKCAKKKWRALTTHLQRNVRESERGREYERKIAKFEQLHEGTSYAQVNKWFFDGFKHIPTHIFRSYLRFLLFFAFWCHVRHRQSTSIYWCLFLVRGYCCVVKTFVVFFPTSTCDPANSLKIFTFSKWSLA